jgi:hypothetical protein
MKQEDYDKVKDKYDLPSFEEISSEFEICAIDVNKVNSLVRAILKVMGTKMGVFLNYLEPVINPSPQGLHAYIEVENTTNDEKKSIFEFYKILSYKYHKSYSLELIGEEELVAKEIKLILKDWGSTKNKFKVLCEIINRAWKKEREKEQIETVG